MARGTSFWGAAYLSSKNVWVRYPSDTGLTLKLWRAAIGNYSSADSGGVCCYLHEGPGFHCRLSAFRYQLPLSPDALSRRVCRVPYPDERVRCTGTDLWRSERSGQPTTDDE